MLRISLSSIKKDTKKPHLCEALQTIYKIFRGSRGNENFVYNPCGGVLPIDQRKLWIKNGKN
jgi:hypothetical protein